MYLTNGQSMPIHCTHISHNQIEVEAPFGLQGSQKVKIELQAINENDKTLIKAICLPSIDILNEHDKHYIKMSFHSISQQDRDFIDHFIKVHT